MNRVTRVEQLLTTSLQPEKIFVDDFSHQHSGRAGTESHISVVIVSSNFSSMNKVQRHRMVYSVLQAELNSGLHALQLQAYTPSEYESANIQEPPRCKGGK